MNAIVKETYSQGTTTDDLRNTLSIPNGAASVILVEPVSLNAFPSSEGATMRLLYADFAQHLETQDRPDLIVTLALADDYDCTEIAQILSDNEFKGSYRALALDLPKPEMIRREVRRAYPDLDFDVVSNILVAGPPDPKSGTKDQ